MDGSAGAMDPVTTLVGTGGMALLAVVVLRAARVPTGVDPLWVIARAAIQLGLLVLVLRFALTDARWIAAWLGVMTTVAVLTSTRRIGRGRRVFGAVAVAIVVGAGVPLAVVFGIGVVPLGAQYLLAFGGITIGNVMSVTTLTGRRTLEQLVAHRDEIEGRLALGATPRQSTARFRSDAVHGALVPSLDQTRTTGLVTMPGAFVGAVFAGADPLQAGLFQLVVLASIVLGGSIAAVVTSEALGSPSRLPLPEYDDGGAGHGDPRSRPAR